jgi:hypothetical protein
MKTPLRSTMAGLCCILAGWLFCGADALAQSRSMNCDTKLPGTYAQLTQDDQNSTNHLQLNRKIASGASVDLDVCAADLTILGGISDQLRVTVDLASPAPNLTAGDYVEALDVTPQVVLHLHLPDSVKAKVVIVIPAATPKLELNLVRGSLRFEAARIGGERKINLVFGHLDFLGNADSYATLEANVVMGTFHDYRQSGQGHGVLVTRSLSGTGKGSIEINVVKGSLDLKPWE